MGKYDAWDGYFEGLEGDEVALSFEQLEEIIGASLPPTAYREQSWWSNVHYYAKWANHGWYASPDTQNRIVRFSRTPPRRGRKPKHAAWEDQSADRRQPMTRTEGPVGVSPEPPVGPRLVLIGCVAQKQKQVAPAKDLYISTLWKKRRRYAESTGQPWGILSSEYGYVDPDTVLEPYDRYMGDQSHEYQEQWSRDTADQVIRVCRDLGLDAVEVHAGAAYLNHGLIAELNRAGMRVLWPLKGMKIGEQLSWYDQVARALVADEAGRTPAVVLPRVDGDVPRIIHMHFIEEFDYRWPDAVEHFDYGWEGEVEWLGQRIRFRHGAGHCVVYGAGRIHTVTWLGGEPRVEGVAADDYRRSRALLSLIKLSDGQIVREPGEVPAGYESFVIVDHRSEIDAPYSRRGLAVKIRVDDIGAWVHHALLRKGKAEQSKPTNRQSTVRTPNRPPSQRASSYEPVDDQVKAVVVARIVEFGDSETAEVLAGADPVYTPDPEANAFLLADPFAFLVAVICDYQIKAERAWETPYQLVKRLGYFDPVRILAEPARLFKAFAQPPALHRYVRRVPEYILEACRIVLDQYEGDTTRLWSDYPTAEELQQRLKQFPGISQKKAAMAVEMLERNFDVPIADMQGSDVALDVHVRRVFLRAGLAERDDVQHIIDAARASYPQRPGVLDLPAWIIGRTWCRPRNPNCRGCVLGDVCPQLIERGDAVRGA